MTNANPYNFMPLQPTGRNETDTANTYAPEDMIKIYEQQFLIQVHINVPPAFQPIFGALANTTSTITERDIFSSSD